MSFILALDQGTTSSRAVVFDELGKIRSIAQQPFRQIFPDPGQVEHDAVEIWNSQLECARGALKNAAIGASDLSALAIANQRETTVIWDRATGMPVYHALVWQDRRTANWCQRQRERGLELGVSAKTGLVLDPYFSASKIVWLLEHVPGVRDRAERGELAFGTIDTWLLWNLTGGVHATDPTNASRTLLYNIHRGEWASELLELFGIPASLMPSVVPSSSNFGQCLPQWLGAALPITGIAGDQQAALFGQNCRNAGQVKNTYGTGCFMLMHTGQHVVSSSHGLLTTVAAQTGTGLQYALEGSVFSAGSAVQWLRDGLRMIDTAAEIESLAASVDDTEGVVLVPAFTGLGSPYWDATARGAILGVTRGTSRAHIARAALESIALQSAVLLRAMAADSGLEFAELRVDGGATANHLLMQIQADLLGVPVVRARVQETTALGAARLAAMAIGITQHGSIGADIQVNSGGEQVFEPHASRDWAQAKMALWEKAVERSLNWSDP